MADKITIRQFKLSDFEELCDLIMEMGKSEAQFNSSIDPSKTSRETEAKILKHRLEEPGTIFFVATNKNKLIAYAGIGIEQDMPDTGRIPEVFIKNEYRRRGIATKLIEKAIEYLQKHKRKFIRLNVSIRNTAARKLYAKLGFHQKPYEYLPLEKKMENN